MKTGVIFSPKPRLAATIGFFDGVHLGHRYLIEQVCEVAASRGLASAVVTFPVHPRRVMHPDCVLNLLTTRSEKEALLSACGLDYCLMPDFTPDVARLSARQFMALLKEEHGVEALVIGHDHRFGHNRAEDLDDYMRYGKELGIEVIRARAYHCDMSTVSSSLIRRHLQAGDVASASRLLGYDYFLQGTVVGGYQVGRTIGFPTANLSIGDATKLVPADGVYAVRVLLGGTEYGGMLSIGKRPTVDNGADRSIEVHIFNFQADIYDCTLHVSFVQRIRDEMKFGSVEELVGRLHQDEKEVRHILALNEIPPSPSSR